jgi:GTP-binding protein HflX
VEDRLFATLDTRTRKWNASKGVEVLLSDTVGFVRNLPHQLVASFKATLEEAVNADLLLHVIDVSSEDVLNQIESVNSVLAEIGCRDKPVLLVLNKTDAIRDVTLLETLETLHRDAVSISAKTGMGLDELARKVTDAYKGGQVLLRVCSAQANGKVQSFLRANGSILGEQYTDGTVIIDVQMGRSQVPELQRLRPEKLEIVRN